MSQRFLDWVAQRAIEDGMRFQMLIFAALCVLLYVAVNKWPVRIRPYGKALIIISGVMIYVAIFAFSLFTLSFSFGIHW